MSRRRFVLLTSAVAAVAAIPGGLASMAAAQTEAPSNEDPGQQAEVPR